MGVTTTFALGTETTTEVGAVAFRLWRRQTNGALSWVGEIAAALETSIDAVASLIRSGGAPSSAPR
jgi:uncharacterized membrane protein